jgi:hypothetical protein
MAERSNAAVLKTVDPKGPGVRIPLSPPSVAEALAKATFVSYFRVALIRGDLQRTQSGVILSSFSDVFPFSVRSPVLTFVDFNVVCIHS